VTTYYVNKVCYLVEQDPAFRERVREDPASALEPFRLSDDERSLLLTGDVARLFQLGAHPFLLGLLARHKLLGLTRETYVARMKALLNPDNTIRMEPLAPS
jgi:hypothetical protein